MHHTHNTYTSQTHISLSHAHTHTNFHAIVLRGFLSSFREMQVKAVALCNRTDRIIGSTNTQRRAGVCLMVPIWVRCLQVLGLLAQKLKMKAHPNFQEKQSNFIWSRAAVQLREEATVEVDYGTLVRILEGPACSVLSPFVVSKVSED